jgi:hypothetical protein
MRHPPGFQRRFALLGLHKDVVRGGLCVILMVALVVGGLPLWLALILPILAYPGLRLITASIGQASAGKELRPTPRTDGDGYAACLELQRDLQSLSSRIEDSQVAGQLRRITAWIDKILGAIAEDEKHQAATPLHDLVDLTKDLLTRYLKVVRRGFDGADVRERVRENLVTLEAAYERFWVQLNRDAVVNLAALSETIDFNLKDLASSRQIGGIS